MLLVWLSWLVLMASANLAAPCTPSTPTCSASPAWCSPVVFSTYAAVLVAALLLFGRLSDRLGRRPVLVGGLAVGALAVVVFAVAGSTGWLFAACGCQGLAVGMVSGPATAALVELEPEEGRSGWSA
jgi:MFS family permease